MVLLKEFSENMILKEKKSADDKKSMKNYPVGKELKSPWDYHFVPFKGSKH